MTCYALASGLRVPAGVVATLDAYLGRDGSPDPASPGGADPAEGDGSRRTAASDGPEEGAPVQTAAAGGTPPAELARMHHQLARIVAPATPRTIVLLHEHETSHPILGFLGPVPLVRRMTVAALVSLAATIALSLSPYVNSEPQNYDLLQSSGLPLLINQLFFLAAAGLGASFAALFRANRYIVRGTYDPKYEATYWIRFILGLIAGMMLATLVPLDPNDTLLGGYAEPTLAMIGGFSSGLVYRVLNGTVEAVGSLFQGDGKALAEAQEQRADALAAERLAASRLDLVTRLMEVGKKLDAGGAPPEARQAVEAMLSELLAEAGAETGSS